MINKKYIIRSIVIIISYLWCMKNLIIYEQQYDLRLSLYFSVDIHVFISIYEYCFQRSPVLNKRTFFVTYFVDSFRDVRYEVFCVAVLRWCCRWAPLFPINLLHNFRAVRPGKRVGFSFFLGISGKVVFLSEATTFSRPSQ